MVLFYWLIFEGAGCRLKIGIIDMHSFPLLSTTTALESLCVHATCLFPPDCCPKCYEKFLRQTKHSLTGHFNHRHASSLPNIIIALVAVKKPLDSKIKKVTPSYRWNLPQCLLIQVLSQNRGNKNGTCFSWSQH